MQIYFTTCKKITFFSASILTFFSFTPSSIAGLTLELAAPSNTPEAAVATALSLASPPGLCPQLLARQTPLSPNETHMRRFCTQLNTVNQTQTTAAFKALSGRAASSITSYTANGFYSLNIGDITKRLAALRKGAMKYSHKTAALFQKNKLIASAIGGTNQLTGGGASADSNVDAVMDTDDVNPENTTANLTPNPDAGFISTGPGSLIDNRLSTFVTGDSVNTKQDETTTLAGYKTGLNALFLGLDYRFTQHIFAGIAVKSLTGDVNLIGNVGTVDVADNSVSLYGSYNYSEYLYFQSTFTVGKGSFDINRQIDFSLNNVAFNETANSNPKGDGLGFSLSSGYDYALTESGLSGVFDLTLNYAKTTINAFTETGAKGFNLQVGEQIIESLSSKVNVQINQAISTAFGVIIPELALAWTHQFITEGEDIITVFDIDTTNKSFRYTTDKIESDFYTLSMATSIILPHGIMGFIQYETVLGINNYTTNAISIGARIEF